MDLVTFEDIYGKELHIRRETLDIVDLIEHDEVGDKPCIRLIWFDTCTEIQVANHMYDVLNLIHDSELKPSN